MIKFLKGDISNTVTAQVPKSKLEIEKDKKVEVILNLMNIFRTQINEWNNRAFKTTTWSVGITISLVAYWILNGNKIGPSAAKFIVIGMLVLGILNLLYLLAAMRSHRGNGRGLVKCEAALKLCDMNEYIEGERFFGYSGKWLPSLNLRILVGIHVSVIILAIVAIIFISPVKEKPKEQIKQLSSAKHTCNLTARG